MSTNIFDQSINRLRDYKEKERNEIVKAMLGLSDDKSSREYLSGAIYELDSFYKIVIKEIKYLYDRQVITNNQMREKIELLKEELHDTKSKANKAKRSKCKENNNNSNEESQGTKKTGKHSSRE